MASLQPSVIFREIRSKQQPPPEIATPREVHARTSHRKTRTGCRVCKIRRVKCDETKPACTRCTSTGRKCEGYPPVSTPSPRESRSPPPAPNPDLASEKTLGSLSLYRLSWEVPGNDAERRSFCYLRERAIYDISGYFESDFWDRLVLQISHTEPAVRHALLALSSLCETYESQDPTDDHDKFREHFALQQYNKAVRLLADSLSTSQSQLDVILTSCLVFVWLEFMRNDLDAGLGHLKGGLKILDDFRQPNKSPSLTSQRIDASLIYLFSRLEIQATVYGSPTSEFVSEGHEEIRKAVPTSFSSIEQARNSLHTLLGTVFRFVRQIRDPDFIESTTKSHPWPDPLSLEATCRSHVAQFRSWQGAIKNSPASTFTSLNPRQTAAMRLLHMYHKTVTILLETLFTHSQMIYDQYDSSFDQVLTLAEQLIHNSQHMGPIIFFDMGVMAPLFYVVLKCRNLALRRKALSLLKLAPCREGMWYRQDVIEYVEWKIDIEERGRGQLLETEALPEEARVYNEHMKEVVINGRQRTVVSFQWQSKDCIEYGEDITDLNIRMGQLL
ncbi:hypothetical protein B0J14DRAFT_611993 [Halenospora varia]|nr:hypothetical protein B0J14DRAFT_611993 [Halenospora varia]